MRSQGFRPIVLGTFLAPLHNGGRVRVGFAFVARQKRILIDGGDIHPPFENNSMYSYRVGHALNHVRWNLLIGLADRFR